MDPRIARTRSSLQQALLDLARERPLETITVGDIAERAGVNRSSFYQHYSDKETLLADALDAAAEEAAAELPTLEGVPEGPPAALFAYLAHVDANAELYRRALGEQGSAVVMARVRGSIENVVRDAVAGSAVPGFVDVPIDVVAAGITGSALGVIRAWVDRDPRPPVETAAAWLWRMLLGPGGGSR
jgi:AcrR family transcriptional regulator